MDHPFSVMHHQDYCIIYTIGSFEVDGIQYRPQGTGTILPMIELYEWDDFSDCVLLDESSYTKE